MKSFCDGSNYGGPFCPVCINAGKCNRDEMTLHEGFGHRYPYTVLTMPPSCQCHRQRLDTHIVPKVPIPVSGTIGSMLGGIGPNFPESIRNHDLAFKAAKKVVMLRSDLSVDVIIKHAAEATRHTGQPIQHWVRQCRWLAADKKPMPWEG